MKPIFSTDPGLQSLAEWVISAGGAVSPDLEFYKHPKHGYTARFTGDSFGSNKDPPTLLDLVSCPTSLIFSIINPRPTLPEPFLSSSSISLHAKACFHLSQHLLAGEASPFWPYLRLLPVEFNTPLYFSESEALELSGTNLGAGDVLRRKSIWTSEWEEGLNALNTAGAVDLGQFTWELFLRAATIYTSRSFPSNLINIQVDADRRELLCLTEEDPTFPVLIPLVDILNHKPNTKIVWQPSPEYFSIKSPVYLAPGDEVFNNYGPKPNEELLMGYGFVLEDNPVDTLAMKFANLPRNERATAWEMRSSKQKWSEVFYLTPSVEAAAKAVSDVLKQDWPGPLVDIFRILLATDYELALLQENNDLTPLSHRNELAVSLALMGAMNVKLGNLQGNYQRALPPIQSEKVRLAQIYRKGQETIMKSKLKNLRKFVDGYHSTQRVTAELYLAQHHALQQCLLDKPLELTSPNGEISFGTSEVVFIIALLHEYSARFDDAGNSLGRDSLKGSAAKADRETWWDQFISRLEGVSGMLPLEFSIEESEMEEEEMEIYQQLLDYCTSISKIFPTGKLDISRIMWASWIIQLSLLNLPDGGAALVL